MGHPWGKLEVSTLLPATIGQPLSQHKNDWENQLEMLGINYSFVE
jgi:hypothetical protein